MKTQKASSDTSFRDDSGVLWSKSSYSGQDNNCIEHGVPGELHAIRDSKDPQRSTSISCSAGAWQAFVNFAKTNQP